MEIFELQADEVILYEGMGSCNIYKGSLLITLTSQKVVVEREKGVFKKERELVDVVLLSMVKFYNDLPQIKQKSFNVEIQTIEKNLTITFTSIIEARKFMGKIIDAVTGTTLAQRSSDKIKGALDLVDETLGFDTRDTIKGVLENGIRGTLLNGLGKKKK